jgi:hypothetical protein
LLFSHNNIRFPLKHYNFCGEARERNSSFSFAKKGGDEQGGGMHGAFPCMPAMILIDFGRFWQASMMLKRAASDT